MNQFARHGARLTATALHAFLGRPRKAWAHLLDELLVQLYLTPTASGVSIEVQLTPGELVSASFAELVDIDGDGVLSAADQAHHIEAFLGALEVRFGGVVVEPRTVSVNYPDLEALASGAGSITLLLEAAASTAGIAEQHVEVTSGYAPMPTVVQSNVTLSADSPVEVISIERGVDGRSVGVWYASNVSRSDPAGAR